MDFELNPEQQLFSDSIKRFAEKELAAGALDRAHDSGFPFELARRMSEVGLLGITIDESRGGHGGDLLSAILAIEAVASACPRSADVVQAGNFGAVRTLAEYGSEFQIEKYMPGILAGRAVISVGMTEPEAGSAVTDLKTMAVREGDHYRINGSKIFSTHSMEASLFLVYLRFEPGVGGIGSILVERDTPGLSMGRGSRFMNGETWQQLYFDDCLVPAGNLLLGPGGFKRQISGFNVERLGNAARSLAVGRHALDIAREHAATRRQFGRPLCEFQGLQWKFAELYLALDAARLLLYRAALSAADGLPDAYQTAAAKLACNQAGFNAANEAMQTMGGMGFSEESIVEYCFRRTRGWMIAGGSVEILKNRIAEHVFDRKFSQRACAEPAK